MSTEKRPYRGGRVDPPKPEDDRPDPGACLAHGCPLRGSIDPGSAGRFMCAAHAFMAMDRWQAITHQVHEHQWLIDHIRSLRADDMHTRWRALADAFWRNSEPELMQPAPFETREMYVYRLHLELLHRVGSRIKRPGHMQPQGHDVPKRKGGLAELLPRADKLALEGVA